MPLSLGDLVGSLHLYASGGTTAPASNKNNRVQSKDSDGDYQDRVELSNESDESRSSSSFKPYGQTVSDAQQGDLAAQAKFNASTPDPHIGQLSYTPTGTLVPLQS